MEKPWKWRIESNPPITPNLAVVVIDGSRWWSWDGSVEVFTNDGKSGVGRTAAGLDRMIIVMVEPTPVLNHFHLDVIGTTRYANRAAVLIRLLPADDELAFWPGADDVQLVADADRGILLSSIALLDGVAYSKREFVEIAFDERYPSETFELTPGADFHIRHVGDSDQ
jgi:hypothetical protein